ncbi:diguanylate phosphodiesterase [Novimethylophilus kurashikiensis]|uniref:Diguanylate phosphodiesterase n=1 Tax=Novimethylophilus kurashikiensis TaxID=1825523 RepID=A0A2R5F9E2_9PROT|nr:hypothetical protein [Novimethylophilus kurashikiensis]GBG14862.1 diguanylate phosphodiesterase [Novimethylophilus kurashikiensis]
MAVSLGAGLALLLGLSASPSHALELNPQLSEATVNKVAAGSFPRTVKGVDLSHPVIELMPGRVLVCMDAQPQFVDLTGHFCAEATPRWSPETASLMADGFQLFSLDVAGLKPAYAERLKGLLNNYVLPRMKPVKLYESQNWLGRKVKSVEPMSHAVNIRFQVW